jgi:hypothetical protein
LVPTRQFTGTDYSARAFLSEKKFLEDIGESVHANEGKIDEEDSSRLWATESRH